MIKHGFPPYLECSSKGDSRFSAFFARVKGRGNRSIEQIYQSAKRFAGEANSEDWRANKGKQASNQLEVSSLYRALWREYISENPQLMQILLDANGLQDMFGTPGSACQATELWDIRIEKMLQDLSTSGHIRVTNKRQGSPVKPDDDELVIPVDRTNPVLGNQHILKDVNDPKARHKVIEYCREDIVKDIAQDGPISKQIDVITQKLIAGESICLDCWCAPLPCHGDVLRGFVIERAWRLQMQLPLAQTKDTVDEKIEIVNSPAQARLF